MALERIPADIRAAGGVARMSDSSLVQRIMDAVTIPVMAKARIGHFAEAQALQALGVDFIDESEVLTPADEKYHCDEDAVHGAVRVRCAGSRRGAAPHRRRRGDDSQQGRGGQRQHRRSRAPHARDPRRDRRSWLPCRRKNWSRARAISVRRSNSSVKSPNGKKLPVVLFCAGGVSTPADAALMMQLGAEGIFVGSGIFNGAIVERRAAVRRERLSARRSRWLRYAKAIVAATRISTIRRPSWKRRNRWPAPSR